MVEPSQIVATARSYLRTPFRHQGRRKGVAIDCVGLVLCVAEDLAIVDVQGRPFLKSDYLNYSSQPVNAFVHNECCRRMRVLTEAEMQPGDVLTMRVPTVPCHTAIVSDLQGGLGIVHAYSGVGRCVENRLDDKWLRRIAGVFRMD